MKLTSAHRSMLSAIRKHWGYRSDAEAVRELIAGKFDIIDPDREPCPADHGASSMSLVGGEWKVD